LQQPTTWPDLSAGFCTRFTTVDYYLGEATVAQGQKSHSLSPESRSTGRCALQGLVNVHSLLARLLVPLQGHLVVALHHGVALVIDLTQLQLGHAVASLAGLQKRRQRALLVPPALHSQPIPVALRSGLGCQGGGGRRQGRLHERRRLDCGNRGWG